MSTAIGPDKTGQGNASLATDEIIDVTGTRVKRRRQLLRRVGGPVLGVALVILSILGISLYSYQANRAGALLLSGAVLDGLQARIGAEMGSYLGPATQAVLIARDMVARHAIPDGQAALEGFAASMLDQVPNLEGFYIANGNGDFAMVRRDPAGGTDTKLIDNRPGGRPGGRPGERTVSSVHLDAAGAILDRTTNPQDDFDPRTRVWYQGALKTDGMYWSSPYVFFTTQAPGITASVRFRRSGSTDRVFGVDITLEALSGFLADLRIGRTGRAAIVDGAGTVIAAPGLARPAKPDSTKPGGARKALTTLAALDDPALTAAYDRFHVEGYGSRTIAVGGTPFVAIASRLPAAGQDWVLLIAAPQTDFTGVAEANSRKNFLLSLITIGLAALLGLWLVRQNRRADRMARLLAQGRETGARETRALSALAAQPGLFDPRQPAPGLTEGVAEMSAARRASIWRLAGESRILRCEDSFEPHGGHIEGLELSRSELPQFFQSLDRGEAIDEVDAAADARTVDLHRLLMRPFGSRTLSVLPVRGPGGLSGAVLIEDAERPKQGRSFAEAVSSIAAMRMTGHEPGEDAARQPDPAAAETGPALLVADDGRAFSSALTPSEAELSGLGAAYFPAVMAMSIRFDDAVSLARSDQAGTAALADEIVRAMQAIAARHALPYMKLTGYHLIAAAGCAATPDPLAAARIADAAVAAREACLSLLAQSGLEPAFRIGLDFGTAFGCALGQGPRLFNLWGDVIRTAELMAHSAADTGSIQVSESAYGQLRQQFLFRARGVFYVPRVGTARTFILAGRR